MSYYVYTLIHYTTINYNNIGKYYLVVLAVDCNHYISV